MKVVPRPVETHADGPARFVLLSLLSLLDNSHATSLTDITFVQPPCQQAHAHWILRGGRIASWRMRAVRPCQIVISKALANRVKSKYQ